MYLFQEVWNLTFVERQCKVCLEFGSHSSKHRKATGALIPAVTGADVDDENGHIPGQIMEDESATWAYGSVLSASSAFEFIFVNLPEKKWIVGMFVDIGASRMSAVREKWLPDFKDSYRMQITHKKDAEDVISIQAIGKYHRILRFSFSFLTSRLWNQSLRRPRILFFPSLP